MGGFAGSSGGAGGLVAFGASGQSAGSGGEVTVTNSGTISTLGAYADAIVAQSIGGGGNGAVSVALTAAAGTGIPVISVSNVSLSVGGNGEKGGDSLNDPATGLAVKVNSTGSLITTSGTNSTGILAQSLGAGGGVGGITVGGDLTGATSLNLTLGDHSSGILAQSIGGGGGVNVDGNAGSAEGNGSSGAITINNSGTISTTGDSAHGIVAQSAGGSGMGGAVDINISGQILTQGQGANGIYAQSKGEAGNGNISVTIAQTGVVSCGSQTATAVKFVDGKNNLLQNYGLIQTPGYAVTSTDGANTTINNYGTMLCSIYLGQGTNVFNNLGTFQSGALVNLGAGNSLISNGTLAIGDQGVVATTTLIGNVVHSGLLQVDVDHLRLTADQLLVSGTTKVAGKMEINPQNLLSVLPGSHQDLIISAAGEKSWIPSARKRNLF